MKRPDPEFERIVEREAVYTKVRVVAPWGDMMTIDLSWGGGSQPALVDRWCDKFVQALREGREG